jgi:hypothetical protein
MARGLLSSRTMYRCALVMALVSCMETPPVQVVDPQQEGVQIVSIDQSAAQPSDILIVIDRSPTIEPYEQRIAEQLAIMGEIAERFEDVHVAVISSDLGGSEPGCTLDGDGARFLAPSTTAPPYLISHKDLFQTHTKNYEGTLGSELAARGALGHAGCARSQPLEAARRALSAPETAGFRRRTAALLIAIISPADDASPQGVGYFAEALQGSSPSFRSMLMTVTASPVPPRLATFAQALRFRFASADITQHDFGPILDVFAPRHFGWRANCLWEPLLDLDPRLPGLQAECQVAEIAEHSEDETLVPACDLSASRMPCWRIEKDERNECGRPDADGQIAIVRRERPDERTLGIAQCRSRR